MKKSLIILATILLAILIGFGIWYVFIREPGKTIKDSLGDILPFGSGEGLNLPIPFGSEGNTDDDYGVEDGKPIDALFRVTDSPVAGAIVLGQGSSTTVRYADRATGHMYDTNLVTFETKKITNTTIPKVYEALFRNDGQKVIFRSLSEGDVIETLSITLRAPSATSTDSLYTSSATLLRGEIIEITSGLGDTIFSVLKDSSSIISSTFDGINPKVLLSSPFTAWRLNPYGNALIAWTKANANSSGYAYTINTTNGSMVKILGPLSGLAVLPDALGDRVIYSYNQSGEAKLAVKNSVNGGTYELYPTTLAEKCVFGRMTRGLLLCGAPSDIGSAEPDNWYKGITHFSDKIWAIDTVTTDSLLKSEPKEVYGVDLDVYQPQLSPDESYLVFINKTDLSLWALKLEE